MVLSSYNVFLYDFHCCVNRNYFTISVRMFMAFRVISFHILQKQGPSLPDGGLENAIGNSSVIGEELRSKIEENARLHKKARIIFTPLSP